MNSNEIIGHKDIIARLDQAVKSKHVASSFLFSGPDGIGKKLVALRLAQALNCRQFTPLESPAIYGGGDKNKVLIPDSQGRVKTPSFLTGFTNQGPCQKCASCRKIAALNHWEVKVITREEKAKNLKIEQIFQLQANISLRPVEADKKVYIIDDAHTLTRDAANGLLKTLEEPPLNSLLILITANPAAL
ncbi:MAG: hypothetical protein HY920_00020, partial [Elusimicrobia bacterium]|nr:hypothetical protein [Elusimicrobiota bacterium]